MAIPTPTTNPLLDWLYAQRKVVSFVLLGIALLLAGWIFVSLLREPAFYSKAPFYLRLFIIAVCVAVGVVIAVALEADLPDGKDRFRVLLMTAGGLIGLALALYGFYLPFTGEYYTAFGSGLTEWRQKPGLILWPAGSFLGGIVLLFLSLSLARGAERTSGPLRRLLYGFNAALSCILLLLILALINLLGYVRVRPFDTLGRTQDFTTSGINSIDSSTQAFLRTLDKPVRVVVLLDGTQQGIRYARDMENLLELCRQNSPNFNWESLNPFRNRKEVLALAEEFQIPEPVGVLVIYGQGKEDRVWDFIEPDQLRTPPDPAEMADPMAAMRGGGGAFDGENALRKSLRYLMEGKSKPKIYFLQGHGEYELEQTDQRRPDVGMSQLRDALVARNYTVQPLVFDAEKAEVPADADVVVIARPVTPIPQKELDALRAFARVGGAERKGGKLMVLSDVVADGARFRSTGLETFLTPFNVRLKDERILALKGPVGPDGKPDPVLISVGTGRPVGRQLAPGSNPISQTFFDRADPRPFVLYNARVVEAINANPNPNAPAPFQVEPILLQIPWRDQGIWTETDLSKNPDALAAEFKAKPDEFAKVAAKDVLPVAVAVTEEGQAMPRNPHAPAPQGVPRMLVFGDATWVSNYGVANWPQNLDLFASCINWLRDRPVYDRLAPSKSRPIYQPKATFTEGDFSNLTLLPGALLMLGVLALGFGVWVVRRR
jgi:hypothetical protein